MPGAQAITRSARVAAWASRRHSATIVSWLHDGALEVTLDDDLDQAIATILNDIAPAGANVHRNTAAERTPADDRVEPKRYGQAASRSSRAWSPSRTYPDRARRAGSSPSGRTAPSRRRWPGSATSGLSARAT
jgi:hypothetical protein